LFDPEVCGREIADHFHAKLDDGKFRAVKHALLGTA
jgi:hypothetical protein